MEIQPEEQSTLFKHIHNYSVVFSTIVSTPQNHGLKVSYPLSEQYPACPNGLHIFSLDLECQDRDPLAVISHS